MGANLTGRKARRVPLLQKVHIQRRKAFAIEHRDWCDPTGEKKWRNILFSDEVKMNLYGNDSKRSVHRPKGKEFASQYTKKTIKHGGGNIMVWGCFSWQGVGPLFRIKDTMTAVEYRDILQNVMLPYAEENMPLRWCYQQDNDPKHTSRLVLEWLRNANISCMQWPSQSPDLNHIENLWSDLKKRLADFAFQNKEQFWQKTKEIWDATPLETCQKLIKSMPNRIGKLIQNHGRYTGY